MLFRSVGCGNCVKVCPTGARKKSGGFPDEKLCIRCGACAEICSAGALEKIGTEWEAEELAQYLERDKIYFTNTGGGVTLSGGDPLFQWQFSLELIRRLKAGGIHTAIETSGFASREVFDIVTEEVDFVIMDLKHHDSSVHRRVTGVENACILENFHRLAASGKNCIIRTPVIPGVNDSKEDICRIAEIAAKAKGLLYYELMPYHPLGTGKLESLGMKGNACNRSLVAPTAEFMEELRAAAHTAGVSVK